jgi:hypothetical protein
MATTFWPWASSHAILPLEAGMGQATITLGDVGRLLDLPGQQAAAER